MLKRKLQQIAPLLSKHSERLLIQVRADKSFIVDLYWYSSYDVEHLNRPYRVAKIQHRVQPSPFQLTEHFADVRLDIHVLQVFIRMRVIQPQCGVQPNGDPDAIAYPCHLTDLGLLPRVRVEGLFHAHRTRVDHKDFVAVATPYWRKGDM